MAEEQHRRNVFFSLHNSRRTGGVEKEGTGGRAGADRPHILQSIRENGPYSHRDRKTFSKTA